MIAVELGQVVATRSVSEWSGESITRTLAVIEVVERHGRRRLGRGRRVQERPSGRLWRSCGLGVRRAWKAAVGDHGA